MLAIHDNDGIDDKMAMKRDTICPHNNYPKRL